MNSLPCTRGNSRGTSVQTHVGGRRRCKAIVAACASTLAAVAASRVFAFVSPTPNLAGGVAADTRPSTVLSSTVAPLSLPSVDTGFSSACCASMAGAAAVAVGMAARRRLKGAAGQRTAAVAQAAAQAAAGVEEIDVAIVGAGPAGYAMAYLLAERHNKKVCLIDPRAKQQWPNNYGVWQEEWDALEAKLQLGLDKCVRSQWDVTDCYFGGSWDLPIDNCLRLDRKYAQVDRVAFKAAVQSSKVQVIEETLDAKAVASNIYAGEGLQHDATGSTLTFAGGRQLRAKVVVDTSGAESRLTIRRSAAGESESPLPGFQIAYGIECIVDGPTHYATDAMTLFDYRTDHLSKDPAWEKRAIAQPTFNYAMPIGPEGDGFRIYFEETSLVARPAVSFEECKRRLEARLEHLNVKVRPGSIDEEEFCYIPMGGALPEPGQRTVAFGGAAAMVHPSTGYQFCRMLAGVKEVSDTLAAELSKGSDFDADFAAAAAYDAIWSPGNIGQRDFALFGGEFLMSLNVESLRGWFQGFFELPTDLWAGFLAGWPTLPGNVNHETWYSRIFFGLQLVVKLPVPVIGLLVKGIATYTLSYGTSLLRSVTPLFGEPTSYRRGLVGDVGDDAAKIEARKMLPSKQENKEEKVIVGWGYTDKA